MGLHEHAKMKLQAVSKTISHRIPL